MQPTFNPFLQSNANTPPTNQQPQVYSTNPVHNSMQIQPQMGMINPQVPLPFNNPNALLPNGQAMPNILPSLMAQQQPGGLVDANANLLGILQMALSAQNQINNLNALGMLLNQYQMQGQMFPPSFPNQSMGFPNVQNPMQNINPAVSVQLPNPSQVAPFNVPPGSHQMGGPQDHKFYANSVLGAGPQIQPNQQNIPMSTNCANASQSLPVATQQVEVNSALQQPQNPQSYNFNRWKGNSVGNGHGNNPNSSWKNSPRKDFNKDFHRGASRSEHQRPQFHNMDYGKRKFGFPNEQKGKGHGYERAQKLDCSNPMNQDREKKRRPSLTYTDQEIKQWRDARRKNYPSNANIERKRTAKVTNSEDFDREAKLVREQLKEILAKQAELGCEVAEVPWYYLSDPRTQRGKSRNKFGKRGRNKKNKNSTKISANNNREPTLLRKLLSADIRKDNRYLLQVFRFMVMNSFFKDWPEKPLKHPVVVVEENGCENELGKDKSLLVEKDDSAISIEMKTENLGNAGDSGKDDDNDSSEDDGNAIENIVLKKQGTRLAVENGNLDGEGHRTEEEGEIVD